MDKTVLCSLYLLASLLTMAWFVEARDPYNGGHLWRVSRYAWLLAESAGFSNADAARISLGGFLHDLGKVGVLVCFGRIAQSALHVPLMVGTVLNLVNQGGALLAGAASRGFTCCSIIWCRNVLPAIVLQDTK